MDRRKFLSSLGRGAILAGMATLSGTLILRNSGKPENCAFDFVCKDCRKLKACKQPEAIILKRKNDKINQLNNGKG